MLLLALTLFFALSAHANQNPFPYNPGFDISSVVNIARSLPSHSWEFGTASEALLELYNPELSVFGKIPFPVPTVKASQVQSLVYAQSKIVLGTGVNSLSNGDGAVGDPASLGVSVVLLGKTKSKYATAAKQTMEYIMNSAPRFWNGAISQRTDVAELWSDFMYMAPPFLAYYAVETYNATLLADVVHLCTQYRQVLHANITSNSEGVWEHIIGSQGGDTGRWSTGNGWAASGMVRVLATVMKAPASVVLKIRSKSVSLLTGYIKEIIDGAMGSPVDTNKLLRNYVDDVSGDGHGYGEISGTSMLAAATYRMAVLCPQVFGQHYVKWADGVRATLSNGKHVSKNGTVYPAVNPLNWGDTEPVTYGSPEGNNFVVLMYAAWRDCVHAGFCHQ